MCYIFSECTNLWDTSELVIKQSMNTTAMPHIVPNQSPNDHLAKLQLHHAPVCESTLTTVSGVASSMILPTWSNSKASEIFSRLPMSLAMVCNVCEAGNKPAWHVYRTAATSTVDIPVKQTSISHEQQPEHQVHNVHMMLDNSIVAVCHIK